MLDETEGTAQDTSSGKTGQSSSSKSGSTSKKGKLYTESAISKIKSDAAAEAGRLRKAAEQERDTLKQDLQSTTSRLDNLERDTNESRLAEARAGGDEHLLLYNREEAVKKRERQVEETLRDITRREGQVKADRTEVDKDKAVVSTAYIAAKHGLETEELESLGISDPEALEKVAEKLAKLKGGEGEGEGGEGEGEEEFMPDTGETTGSGEPTREQLEKMPMSQYAAHVAKRDEKK